METRMHPRSDANQRCLTFQLSVTPRCRVFSYRDHMGNNIHHFDIPAQHSQLVIVAESLVEMQPQISIPASLPSSAWDELDHEIREGDFWEMLLPSEYAAPTPELDSLATHFGLQRRDDPLSLLHTLNDQIYRYFDYKPKSTRADSPIDLALTTRAGVCQDFAHIAIAIIRSRLRIPCRYVSGYLHHGGEAAETTDANDRSEATNDAPNSKNRSEATATHAWIEAFLPELGWVGFDPTNNLVCGERHIRTAIGRDYADVPPTHGMYRGRTRSELTVAVQVTPSEGTPQLDRELPVPEDWSILVEKAQALPDQPTKSQRRFQQAQQQQ